MSGCEAVVEDLPPCRRASNRGEFKAPSIQSDRPMWQQGQHPPHVQHWVDVPLSSPNRRMPPIQTRMTGPWSHVEQSAWNRQMSHKGCAGYSTDVSDIASQMTDELANGGVNPLKQQGQKFCTVLNDVSISRSTPTKDHTIPVPSLPSHLTEKFPHSASNVWRSDRKRGTVGRDDSARSVIQKQSSLNSRTARWVQDNSQAKLQGGTNALPPARQPEITPNIAQQSRVPSAKTGCSKVSRILQLSCYLKRLSCGGAIAPGLGDCLHQRVEKKGKDGYCHEKKCNELAPISIPQPQMHCGDVVDLAYGDGIPQRNPQGMALSDMWSSSDATDWTAFGKGGAPSMSSESSIRHQNGAELHPSYVSIKGNNHPKSIHTKTNRDYANDVSAGGGPSPSSSISLFRPRLVFDVKAMEQLKAVEAQNDRRFPDAEENSIASWTDYYDTKSRHSLSSMSRDSDVIHVDKMKSLPRVNAKRPVVPECGWGKARVGGERAAVPAWLPKMDGMWKRAKQESDEIEALYINQQEGCLHRKTSNILQHLQVRVSEKSFHYGLKAYGSQGAEFVVLLSGEISAQMVSDGKGGGLLVHSHLKMFPSGLRIKSEWGHHPNVVCADSFEISDNGNSLIWRTSITKDGQTSFCTRRVYHKA